MCTNIAAAEFRRQVKDVAGSKANLVMLYLKTVGALSEANNGKINLVTNIDVVDRTKKLVMKIKDGDLAWVFDQGFVVVIDTHPRVDNDGHHCRVIKVKMNDDGVYSIDSSTRSNVVRDDTMLRIRSTNFDLRKLEELTYERYNLFARLAELNAQIEAIREGDIPNA